jgi:hypothetical protein
VTNSAKKSSFSIIHRWAVNGGYFEILIGVDDMDRGREAKFGDHNIGGLHFSVIPQQEDAPSRAIGRAIGEASKTFCPKETSISRGDGVKFCFLQADDVAYVVAAIISFTNSSIIMVIETPHVLTQEVDELI